MIKAQGKIAVEPHKGRIVLNVSPDFVKLYNWFISNHYWIKMNTPLHGAHVTIYNTKHHKKVNWNKAVHYHNKQVEFNYDEYIIEGGYRKGFIMYYIKVYARELETMKKRLGIQDGDGYRGLHITLCNGKSNTAVPSWPKIIEIR